MAGREQSIRPVPWSNAAIAAGLPGDLLCRENARETPMARTSPVWDATLHHLSLESAKPAAMLAFYRDGFGYRPEALGEAHWLLAGRERRLLLKAGRANALGFAAFRFPDRARLEAYREHLRGQGVNFMPSPTPLFGEEAFALTDPDGHMLVFGLPKEMAAGDDPLPGRLQHFVVASSDVARMVAFYRHTLGFVLSDEVWDGAERSAVFLRSDTEHHSFAVFRAAKPGFDHHACETTGWNDLRDWADRFANLRVPLWWGPGRHGPGDNLFFMVQDPEGNKIELSAELEAMPIDQPARNWPHEQHTLNSWGQAWMRS